MEMFLPGLISACAILVMLMQFDWQKVLGISLLIDVLSTILLAWMFSGTFSGMMTGIFGGLFITLVLYTCKQFMPYKRLTWRGWQPVVFEDMSHG